MNTATYTYDYRHPTEVLGWSNGLSSARFIQSWLTPLRSQIIDVSKKHVLGNLVFSQAFGPSTPGFGFQNLFFENTAKYTSPKVPFLVHYPAVQNKEVGKFVINPTHLDTPEMVFTYGYGSPFDNFVTFRVSIMFGHSDPWQVGNVRFTRDESGPLGFTLVLDSKTSFEALAVIYSAAIAVSKSGAFGEDLNDPGYEKA